MKTMFKALWISSMVLFAGCVGLVEDSRGVDDGSWQTHKPCTDYHTCCPPKDLRCEAADPDTNAVCTCDSLWRCNKELSKCDGQIPTPAGGGSWDCSWSEKRYECRRPGSSGYGPPGGGGWTCRYGDIEFAWICTREPPNPSNDPGGASSWRCRVDGVGKKLFCVRKIESSPPSAKENCGNGVDDDNDGLIDCKDLECPPCPPPAKEICGNGVDDDNDGLIDCKDADCPPCPPTCTSPKVDPCSIPNCNKFMGYKNEYNKCIGSNLKNCTGDQLKAWCSRRFSTPGPGSHWYTIHEAWVKQRCSGKISYANDTYSCVDTQKCVEYKCVTPLVLTFDAGHVSYQAGGRCSAAFDLSAAQDGSATRTDWPSAKTPWLVMDRDGDGAITSGRELFGSATLVQGKTARHGFEALAALDHNGDGVIDARDPAFARLRLWFDQDGDRRSNVAELRSLRAASVVSLSLNFADTWICDARGNCEGQRAAFSWRDSRGRKRVGEVVDVHLSVSPSNPPSNPHSDISR